MAQDTNCHKPAPEWKSAYAKRTNLVQISNYCPERPYVELQVSKDVCPIHQLVFRIVAHDQGFSDDQTDYQGTYEHSHSWFEASVIAPSGRDRSPRRYLQCNAHAIIEFREHEIRWNYDDADLELQRWLLSIQPDDTIQIVPKARHLAWRNIVKEAEITAFSTGTEQIPLPLQVSASDVRVYRPLETLKETRLVVIRPGTGDSGLKCHLEPVIIGSSSQKPYECLSYCWGDRTDPKHITVSCFLEDNSLPVECLKAVTSNLNDVLLSLRHPSQPRIMWIDALSINQNDEHELSSQVAMMREIYSHAQRVIVWLGSRTKTMDECMKTAEEIQQRYREFSGDFKSSEVTTRLHAPILDEGSYGTKNPLFQNEYFRRAWVLQEISNGTEVSVLYGNEIKPWSMVLRLNECITRSTLYENPVPKNVMAPLFAELFTTLPAESSNNCPAYCMGYLTRSRELRILDVILEGLDLETTDPRDKIFALLSFGQETSDFSAQPASIRPDYTKSVARVFADFTRWWITTYQSLQILSVIHMSRGRTWMRLSSRDPLEVTGDRASWSLWHDGRSVWSQSTLGLKPDSPYQAAGKTTPVIQTLEDPMLLSLSGRQVGVIGNITHFPYYPIFFRNLTSSSSPTPTHIKEIYDAYVHVFDPSGWQGTWTSTVQRDDMRKLRRLPDDDKIKSKNIDHLRTHTVTNSEQSLLPVIQHASYVSCHDRCFFHTSQGIPGLCPATARPGDIVVVLYGARVPYILRAQAAEGGIAGPRYTLIGECYLQGYMHGRAVEKVPTDHQEDYPEQTFDLI